MDTPKTTHTVPARTLLEIRTVRTGEETPEAMMQFLTSLTSLRPRLLYFMRRKIPLSLELVVYDQTIRFFLNVPTKYQAFVESQLVAQYPKHR